MRQALVQKWLRSSPGVTFRMLAAIVQKQYWNYQEYSSLALCNKSKAAKRKYLGRETEDGCGRMAKFEEVKQTRKP